MTVPERSLNTSWLKISTGRSPACSRPLTGFRSAQRISPLNIRAILTDPQKALLRPAPFRTPDRVWRILGPDDSVQDGQVFPLPLPAPPDYDSETLASGPVCRDGLAWIRPGR